MDLHNNYIFGPVNLAPLELEADPLGCLTAISDKYGRVLAAYIMGMWVQRMQDCLPRITGNFLWDKFVTSRNACEKMLMPLEGRTT